MVDFDKDTLREGEIKEYMQKAVGFMDNYASSYQPVDYTKLVQVSFQLTAEEAKEIFTLLSKLRSK